MVSIIKNDLSKNYEKSKNRDCLGKHDYNKNLLVNIFLLFNTMILWLPEWISVVCFNVQYNIIAFGEDRKLSEALSSQSVFTNRKIP